jgi:hypothetical protein
MKKSILIPILVITGFGLLALGWFGHSFYAIQQTNSASKQASSFIADVLDGKSTNAYALSSSELKDKQNQANFVNTFKDEKTDKPVYGKASVMTASDGKVVYIQSVEGLPKTKDGRTLGIFTLTLVNENGWKVNSASIN